MARPEGDYSAGFGPTGTDLPLSEGARGESGENALSCTQSGAHRPYSTSTIRRKLDEDVAKLHLPALPFAAL